jgi:hypothetical protein
MKHFCILLFIQLLGFQAFAVDKNWTGTVNLDWNTDGNWSPAGVPGAGDNVFIHHVPNAPRILGGATATINDITLQNGSALTIEANATLRVSRNVANSSRFSAVVNATLTNHGSIIMEKPQLPSEQKMSGFTMVGTSAIHNHGLMNINVAGDAVVYFMPSSSIFTNYGTGSMTLNSEHDLQFYDPGQFINHGLVLSTGASGAYITAGTLTNYGLFLMTGSFLNAGNTTNAQCAQIVASSITADLGSFSNAGLVYITGQLHTQQTRFTNNGVVKYGTLSGVFTNNQIAIVDNADPIFTFGGSITQTIEGIYLDREGTEPAGTYVLTTNKFTPNTDLPPGPTTLYVKVTPEGNSCSFTVPFVHTITVMPVTLVSFSGEKAADHQTLLKWLTADERDFDRFEIQRSADARSFETIGVVAGGAGESALTSYEFTDSLAKGAFYYRLKMVDTDRTFTYSKVIYARNAATERAGQAVAGPFYPNPSQGAAQIDLYVAESGSWTITMMDKTGKAIRSESRVLQKGMNKVAVGNLTSGLNLIRFENGKETILRKIVSR